MSAVIFGAIFFAVSLGLASSWLVAQEPFPQYGRKPAVDKGPRALGLVQLSPSGNSPKGNKGRLIPIVIMIDGKYYDAGSYKAAPVPMALDFDTVYEAFRTGVSQGTFTITQPGQLNHTWIAEGTWLPAGAKAPEKSKKYSAPVIADDEKDGRPVLHRRSEKSSSDSGSDSKDKDNKDKDDAPPVLHRSSEKSDSDSGSDGKDKDKEKDKDQQKAASPPASPTGAPPAGAPTPADAGKTPAPPESSKASASDENIADPNRPKLRRGKPDLSARHEPFTTFDELADIAPGAASLGTASSGAARPDGKTAKDPAATPPPVVFIPAISDAGGPEARPYTYDLKPAEEAIYRNKMLDLATTQLVAQASVAAKEAAAAAGKKASTGKAAGKSAGKLAKPVFDDVSLRVFDLSNSNEPVLVLSAKTHPSAGSASGNVEEPKEITLIARTNLEGELRKLFFSQTDSRHLDMTPRMELIDAVDADGDGRGELLFRRTFDGGSAYAIYRVTADRLWPLFEGAP